MEKVEKNSFVFYRSFYECFKKLEPSDTKELLLMICSYCLDDESPHTENIYISALFEMFRGNLDISNKRYKASVENGKKGGNPNFKKGVSNPYYKDNQKITQHNLDITQDNPEITQTLPRDNLNDNDNVNVNVNDNVNVNNIKERKSCTLSKEKKITRFVKPSVNDIENYLKEKKWDDLIDAEMFWDYYESKGWKVGNTPMKDWKACCRTWINKRNQTQPLPTPIRKDKVCEDNDELTEEEIMEMMGGI